MFAARKTDNVSSAANYIEECFSVYLYTGTGSSQTITNNIDTSTKGGLVWIKGRSGATGHRLTDTVRGATKSLESNSTAAEATESTGLTAFGTTGFTIGADADYNTNAATYVSWTFREQAKFFDVVTYAGDGTSGRTIAHNLQSAPGFIAIKAYSGSGASTYNWICYHRSLGTGSWIELNQTSAKQDFAGLWTNTNSSTFDASSLLSLNDSGKSYVAYLFAHDAGGFGATGSDNVISCGTYNYNATRVTVNLGWEPQWLLVKEYFAGSSDVDRSSWHIVDNMRGIPMSGSAQELRSNASNAEVSLSNISLTSTGFEATPGDWNAAPGGVNGKYIYIAIRRGPMKTPTSGTSVFGLSARSGTGANATVTGSAGVSDAVLIKNRGSAVGDLFAARLTGTGYLETSSTAAEVAAGTTILQANPWDVMDGVKVGTTSTITNATSNTYINYLFDRAPGFFDVVCYSGNSVNGRTVTHNLGVTPQLIIVKPRTIVVDWSVYAEPAGNTLYAPLNDAVRFTSAINCWNNTSPTASVFSLSNNAQVNRTGDTYVAYLFATCTGVSKVGSYTGTGALQTVDCGFSAGARFVLIHRIDVNADWYVWDSARGITSGNDPYLLLNSTAAEVTTTNYVDTDSTGFKVTAAAPAGLNASGGSYLFLAIA